LKAALGNKCYTFIEILPPVWFLVAAVTVKCLSQSSTVNCDNVRGAVIITIAIARVHPVDLMNAD